MPGCANRDLGTRAYPTTRARRRHGRCSASGGGRPPPAPGCGDARWPREPRPSSPPCAWSPPRAAPGPASCTGPPNTAALLQPPFFHVLSFGRCRTALGAPTLASCQRMSPASGDFSAGAGAPWPTAGGRIGARMARRRDGPTTAATSSSLVSSPGSSRPAWAGTSRGDGRDAVYGTDASSGRSNSAPSAPSSISQGLMLQVARQVQIGGRAAFYQCLRLSGHCPVLLRRQAKLIRRGPEATTGQRSANKANRPIRTSPVEHFSLILV